MNSRGKDCGRRRSEYAKSDLRYWQDVVYRPKFGRKGRTQRSAFYVVRIGNEGQRTTFPLGTSNKTAAAAKAREIYNLILASGWEAACAAFKKDMKRFCPLTVGELINEAWKHLEVRERTFGGYCRSLRKIVSDICGLAPGASKFDYQTGGRAEWLSQVDSVRLAKITPEKVKEWRSAFLERAKDDAAALRSARISASTFIREAKALFSNSVLEHLEGVVSPFEGLQASERIPTRYRSQIPDLAVLIRDACRELNTESRRECFKAFLLACLAGLRRSEIDLLEWNAFDFERGILRIEATKYFAGKSETSLGDIPLDAELLELFASFKAQAAGPFVIRSTAAPKVGATYSRYRCQRMFDELIGWLRVKGDKSRSPLHILRKEFGSAMAQQFGIFAASRALRHSSVSVTEGHYIDQKRAASIGLGYLLAKPGNVVDFQPNDSSRESAAAK